TRVIGQLEAIELTEIKEKSLYLLIDQLQIELADLHNAIAHAYFSLERVSNHSNKKALGVVQN
ncbi:MAG: hypothetical protein R3240_13515, partial [Gammaproteobacteria bacterium]|nr:hypothetical protein [Gammaproteobacteria bacterium]